MEKITRSVPIDDNQVRRGPASHHTNSTTVRVALRSVGVLLARFCFFFTPSRVLRVCFFAVRVLIVMLAFFQFCLIVMDARYMYTCMHLSIREHFLKSVESILIWAFIFGFLRLQIFPILNGVVDVRENDKDTVFITHIEGQEGDHVIIG